MQVISSTDLWQPWRSLFPQAPENSVKQAFQDIIAAYSSPERHYHTIAHIVQILSTIRELRPENAIAVQIAAWFHDVVYDSQAQDNEERSADVADQVLRSLQVDPETIAIVRQLILCTKHHQADDRDSEILLDADLAILGAVPANYQIYATAIRQEYAWVPDAQYRAGRKQVLEKFLQRDRIFLTTQLFEQLEAPARANLQAEIQALEKI